MLKKITLASFALAVMLTLACGYDLALAQDSTTVMPMDTTAPEKPAGGPVETAPKQVTPVSGDDIKLKGGASVVHVEIENVRDVQIDIKRAKANANHLFDEMTRHPITSYQSINTMGPVMMTFIEPTFDMKEVLPARQRWVELYMRQIAPTVALIKEDFDAINSGRNTLQYTVGDKEKLDEHLNECFKQVEAASATAAVLQTLTAAPPYDNLAVSKQAVVLAKSLDEMDKATKHLIGELKKEQDR
ncbi:MAG: hypothetical protein P4L53_10555 [Candidatus Obscuribacterales bacterium]|nr:hypothetical protein [Candidatus Obscuribacterales bacterium]